VSEHIERTLEMVVTQIADLERQIGEKKKIANGLCQLMGRDALYLDSGPNNHGGPLRPDEFYGRPLATVVQQVLERRRLSGLGAATVPEIYETLVQGGFHFNTKNAENAKRNLYQSLGKNMKFHRLPNGSYGLSEWYPNLRRSKDLDESESDEQASNGTEPAQIHVRSKSGKGIHEEAEASGGPKKPR
jgi:hypothetical protein